MIRLTGLWKSKTRDGKIMLKGKLGQTSVIIIQNTDKNSDSQPDYSLFFSDGSDLNMNKPEKKDQEEL